MTKGTLILVREALELTKCDAEKSGFTYGPQSNVNRALAKLDAFIAAVPDDLQEALLLLKANEKHPTDANVVGWEAIEGK